MALMNFEVKQENGELVLTTISVADGSLTEGTTVFWPAADNSRDLTPYGDIGCAFLHLLIANFRTKFAKKRKSPLFVGCMDVTAKLRG
jgi:hypothetical protein